MSSARLDREFRLDGGKMQDIAAKAVSLLRQEKEDATGEKQRALEEAIKFIDQNPADIARHFQDLVRSFCRNIFTKLAGNQEIEQLLKNIEKEKPTQAELAEAI